MAGNIDNIKPHWFKKGDTSGKAVAGKLGGIASGESKQEGKRMLKALEFVLNSPVAKNEQLFGEQTTQLMLGMHALAEKMKAGDVKAAEFIRDLIGEKPDTNITVKDIKTVPYEYKDKTDAD